MTVERFSLNDAISVTPAAQEHFLNQLQKHAAKAIRLSLKESGCTGYMYVIDEVDAPEDSDLQLNLDNGLTLYVDPQNLPMLSGTVVDYRKEGLNRNLIMDNPNVKHACGCGESFSF